MKWSKGIFRANALSSTTLRRLRNTPSYFFLVWRWSMWLYALIVINFNTLGRTPLSSQINTLLLIITFIQTLVVTLYTPIFQIILPRLNLSRFSQFTRQKRRSLLEDDEADLLTPLAQTRNHYWDIAIQSFDVLFCGLVMYYGGAAFSNPPFGSGSPFYRYGISTAFAAALAYGYRGGLLAALGYDLFAVLGMFFHPPGSLPHVADAIDITGSLIDAPLAAILAAYLASLLASYAQSKKREQDNVRRQKALLSVRAILHESHDKERLLQKSAEQLRHGGHFYRLIIALINHPNEEESESHADPQIETCIEVNVPDSPLPPRDPIYLQQTIRTGRQIATFERSGRGKYGSACLYLPFFREGEVQMVIGAESWRQTDFDNRQMDFLSIAGDQLLVALDNMRLTEQMLQLAAAAERGRIAREIHDGIAQLTYMLSLNAETCATQAHRIAEASEEDAELLTPLAQRLDKLVTISKQALWETRNYMFSLKPLMSGDTTLTQMLTNQIHEFETISDLPVHLAVEGSEERADGDRRRSRKQAQTGAAIFRIVQEALTNAYKHAHATQLGVYLRYLPDAIEVEICDNGRGLPALNPTGNASSQGESQRVYSGHGMRGMRERAEELGGTFEVSQSETGGVKVRVQIAM
ncbi:MAG TPA: GAF domain-containing sensor histidine kinase [Ktedonosporobacter sp.]|nr:GAF domain-containing sensor histidine kinase [Ktedonosporobacter sp.]